MALRLSFCLLETIAVFVRCAIVRELFRAALPYHLQIEQPPIGQPDIGEQSSIVVAFTHGLVKLQPHYLTTQQSLRFLARFGT